MTNRTDQAAENYKKALGIFPALAPPERIAELNQRMDLYRDGKPYVQTQ